MTTPRTGPGRVGRVGERAGQPLAAGFFVGAFLAVAFVAVAFAGAFFAGGLADDAFAVVRVVAFGASAVVAAAAVAAAAASARAVFETAARALPAAVWAPFALLALPAAIRALAAFAAWAFEVVLTTRPEVWTETPPVAALNFKVRRDLRRAAAFAWIAPVLAARSSAEWASARALAAVSGSPSWVATLRALATKVLAALRRG